MLKYFNIKREYRNNTKIKEIHYKKHKTNVYKTIDFLMYNRYNETRNFGG